MPSITLAQYLLEQQQSSDLAPELAHLIASLATTCQRISQLVSQGELGGVLGAAGTDNVQGEAQKKLDVIANNLLLEEGQKSGLLAAIASEELDHPYLIPATYPRGNYLLLFDPLDGSSNIDVNLSIGTIFSILPKPETDADVVEADFLQPGTAQVCAGYALYGPQTMLVLTLGHGVEMFTLDPLTANFVLTQSQVRIPVATQEFAINMSNQRHWAAPVKRYIDECLAGSTGVRAKNFNMRWIASMVADVHRILCRGGVFLYPWDNREPDKPGKLRLMYEANPMSFLIEQAGGASTNGALRMLALQPHQLHQRVPVVLGAKEEVERITHYHQLVATIDAANTSA